MIDHLIEVIGWSGSVLVVIAYWLLSNNKISNQSTLYQGLNIAGSLALIIHTYHYSAYPSMLVNIIWAIIALFAFTKLLNSNKN